MCQKVGNIVLVTVFGVFSCAAEARYIRGRNWADTVEYYTERIQNYGVGGPTGGVLMEPKTTWWVLGPNDCDMNGDMDAFTQEPDGKIIDNDYVSGWRGSGAANENQEIIVRFDCGLQDVAGANDLVIRLYCGGKARCSVWASTDSNDVNDFVKIGEVIGHYDGIPGTPGKLYDAFFDFKGIFLADVHFVRVYRETVGADTGMFFDSFASATVKEPNSCEQVASLGWCIDSDINFDCYVDFWDYAALICKWHMCNDPSNPDCDHSGFPDPNQRPSSCYGVWQSGFGMEGDLNHDCYVDLIDFAELAGGWLRCNSPHDPACEANLCYQRSDYQNQPQE